MGLINLERLKNRQKKRMPKQEFKHVFFCLFFVSDFNFPMFVNPIFKMGRFNETVFFFSSSILNVLPWILMLFFKGSAMLQRHDHYAIATAVMLPFLFTVEAITYVTVDISHWFTFERHPRIFCSECLWCFMKIKWHVARNPAFHLANRRLPSQRLRKFYWRIE